MKKFLTTVLLSASLLSGAAQAELVNADWKVEGDGLAALDTSTGLEWLDVTITAGMSIFDVKSTLDNYEGFRLATASETEALYTNYLAPTMGINSDWSLLTEDANNFKNVFGHVQPRTGLRDTFFLYETPQNKTSFIGMTSNGGSAYMAPVGVYEEEIWFKDVYYAVGLVRGGSDDLVTGGTGSLVGGDASDVSATAPIMAGAGLSLLGLAGLRRKNKIS